jgi:hypothetical protein
MRQHILNAAVAERFAACVALSGTAAAFAEVKKGDLGATCTSQNPVINGRWPSVKSARQRSVPHDGEQLP